MLLVKTTIHRGTIAFTWASSWVGTCAASCGLVALIGCQPQNQLSTKPVAPAQPPMLVESQQSEQASSLSALAAQSQRDVDLILKSRESFQSGAVEPPPPLPQPTRSKVVWNEATPAAPTVNTPPVAESLAAPVAAPPVSENSKPIVTVSLEPDRLKSLMVDLSRELYASGSYSNTPLRELLMISAMSMIDSDRQLDPNAIPDLNEKERELLTKLQSFFAELGRSIKDEKDTERAIIDAVAKLREGLVKPPSLRLSSALLCTRVGGFGDYSAFDKNSFLAQSQQKVIVYLEIADFTSELNQKNEFVTQIAQQLTIYSDRDGIPVWKEDWQTAVDVTKNKRQDFFTVQVVTLPKALTVGKYQLKVRARDEKSGAEAETTIPFELVADARLAASVGK